ncbi:hypothetical protein Sango_0744100 [Sesamum angolense]|uniref:Bet v I/Major latex protein domain-containing protein n=1 Tax=Sesamum angolense TaxID=2727404 RepID=A0AAE1X1Y1_9LAMI|nr:hypothetical protein Sango_0744100 [Sesamum angolense]
MKLKTGTGTAGLPWYKEKCTVVDDERRVKDAEMLEGGLMDLGFTLYRYQMEVIEKEGKREECIVRGSIEFELKEEAAANAALGSSEPLVAVMQVTASLQPPSQRRRWRRTLLTPMRSLCYGLGDGEPLWATASRQCVSNGWPLYWGRGLAVVVTVAVAMASSGWEG